MSERLRFSSQAARSFRDAVREADGVEVFAIGDVEGGAVVGITVAARGTFDRVLAILGRPRSGQVVVHNHPSGDLRPSDPDLSLASRFSEDGVGFVIVDDEVTRSNFVVEPWLPAPLTVDADEVRRFFVETLPTVLPGHEARAPQLQMADAVVGALNEGRPLLIEAGTGTGKSLAYLVPAALWAVRNDAKVVVATHTRSLQAQLLQHDLPLLTRAGLGVRHAVLEGRSNYLCKRRLGLAVEEQADLDDEARAALDAVVRWSEVTPIGSRSELGFPVPPEVWERVESDSELTLRLRCPHHETCHFYEARRRAAGAHLVVVNHALLMADLVLRDEVGFGVLPAWKRVVIDEAHHLEDVATGAGATRVTARMVTRALTPLLPRRSRPGSLARLSGHVGDEASIPADVKDAVARAATDAFAAVERLPGVVRASFGELAGVLDPAAPARRVDAGWEQEPEWVDVVRPHVGALARAIEEGAGLLARVDEALADQKLPESKAQPLLDLRRARGRLDKAASALRSFLELADTDVVRWLELDGRRQGSPTASVCAAPIDVAPMLRRLLWEAVPGAVSTSATLSVAGDFRFFRFRHGLGGATEVVLPSPFDHFEQALLALPTDLPSPEHPAYLAVTAARIVEAVRISGGGAFVLCTSFTAVDAYAAALRDALGPGVPVLAHGQASRTVLLDRFRDRPDAVLVGTDSFWEGVSVKGDGLRLVVLPRLPFRVPTDPLRQARHEKLEKAGVDPFRAYTLPQAVLKLRQGYGRLLRSRQDRGVVLLLDVRVHEKAYGRQVLAALPPARRVKGPWSGVAEQMRRFFGPRDGSAVAR
jgi:ATP-dependent DNA helicase DinG